MLPPGCIRPGRWVPGARPASASHGLRLRLGPAPQQRGRPNEDHYGCQPAAIARRDSPPEIAPASRITHGVRSAGPCQPPTANLVRIYPIAHLPFRQVHDGHEELNMPGTGRTLEVRT